MSFKKRGKFYWEKLFSQKKKFRFPPKTFPKFPSIEILISWKLVSVFASFRSQSWICKSPPTPPSSSSAQFETWVCSLHRLILFRIPDQNDQKWMEQHLPKRNAIWQSCLWCILFAKDFACDEGFDFRFPPMSKRIWSDEKIELKSCNQTSSRSSEGEFDCLHSPI